MVNKPKNLHFSNLWKCKFSLKDSKELKDYKQSVESFLCEAVHYLNRHYNLKKNISVQPTASLTADGNGILYQDILYIESLNSFKKKLSIPVFDSSNSTTLINLQTSLAHELGHVIYNDQKMVHFKDRNSASINSNFLLAKSLIETRVDIFARILMECLTGSNTAKYDWCMEKSTIRTTGYFKRDIRISLVNTNKVYNEIIIQAVYKEYEKEYDMPIKVILHSTLKYISKGYTKKNELHYFENLFGIPFNND